MTRVSTVAPQVDPNSPNGHIVASRAFLTQHLGGRVSETLRTHLIGESAGSPKLYWFRDTPEVRHELGMEVRSEK